MSKRANDVAGTSVSTGDGVGIGELAAGEGGLGDTGSEEVR